MALTQSARSPGPSWDEEVVPALRKRLESESRTLARRMSAASLSSMDESPASNFSILADATVHDWSAVSARLSQSSAGSTHPRPSFQSGMSVDRDIPSSSPKGASTPSKHSLQPSHHRPRTYSQPYLSDIPNGKVGGVARPKVNGDRAVASPEPSIARSSDVKPTRIPKVSRGHTGNLSINGPTLSTTSHNGYGNSPPVSSHNQYHSPDLYIVHEAPTNGSRSTVSSRQNARLLNEPAPFNPGSLSSSIGRPQNETNHDDFDEVHSRLSNESEERPFEHWYRGEVSRNGGVGELRVGRRLEMLEIANYGHTFKNNALPDSRTPIPHAIADSRWRRKRADSIAGIGTKGRERGSLYLDDEDARKIGRVLDESPLTDLESEGEGSDLGSTSDYHDTTIQPDHYPIGLEDISTRSAPLQETSYDTRSTTPIPATAPVQRPPSRQQNAQPTRIPLPPSSRPSTDTTRVSSPTRMSRGSSEPPASHATRPSISPTPSSSRQPQQSRSTPSPGKSRGVSPASTSTSKKSRTTASKVTRAKTLANKREKEELLNRRSVAFYPAPAGGDDDMMMDAIPSWTQPVPTEGNWDDVVLPVVARKKGMDGHYEQADGSPKPKPVTRVVEPAPGTFGFDHSKYRPPRESESIPMDEFGRRPSDPIEDEDPGTSQFHTIPTTHDEIRLPVGQPPLSPAPFSHYASKGETVQDAAVSPGQPPLPPGSARQDEEEEVGGGCCKCVIM